MNNCNKNLPNCEDSNKSKNKDLLSYEDNSSKCEKKDLLSYEYNSSQCEKKDLLSYEDNSSQCEKKDLSQSNNYKGSKKVDPLLFELKNNKIVHHNSKLISDDVNKKTTCQNNRKVIRELLSNNKDINLLKGPKDFKICIEKLKRHVLKNCLFIYCDDLRVYVPNGGYYKKISYHEAAVMITSVVDDDTKLYLTPRDIKETFKSITYEPKIQVNPELINNHNEFLINCLNGVIDLNNLINNLQPVIIDHQPNCFFFNCINANYLPNSSIKNSHFEVFLYTITGGDSELEKLIQQMLGYLISNFNNAKKAFFLYGKSNTGKSVFLKILSKLCGEDNISNVGLQDLSDPKYTANLFGKVMNICSEQPFSFYNGAKLVFATNNLPNLKMDNYKDNTAYFNRIIIIPFRFNIPEYKQDKNLFFKLFQERDIIFSWAVNGLIEYIKNGFMFNECQVSLFTLKNYRDTGNTMTEFVNSKCILDSSSYVHMDMLFQAYVDFCHDYYLDIPSKSDRKNLKNLIENMFNLDYRRLNRTDGNKYGFEGICLKDI